MALNRKLIEKWVNRLESGRYEQGQYQLYNEDSCRYSDCGGVTRVGKAYCCLGVLGCIMTKRSGDTFPQSLRDMGSLPTKMWEKTGMRTSQDQFIRMNDGQGMTFKEIAAWIRKHILRNRNPNRRKK